MSEYIEINQSCSNSNSSQHLKAKNSMEIPIKSKQINTDENISTTALDKGFILNESTDFGFKNENSKQINEDQQVTHLQLEGKSINGNINCSVTTNDDGQSDFEDSDDEQNDGDMDVDDDDDDEDDDNDDEEQMDTDDSSFSSISEFSEFFGQGWKAMNWLQSQMSSGVNPREILSQILMKDISPDLDEMNLWKILASMLTEPPRRQKLPDVNTINDVVNLLKISQKIIVLTGAGVSVSCGIPDFRSADGIYSRLAKDYPDLPDPQAMFDIQYFSNDPRPFFKFAREIYPGQFTPSLCHRFIKFLEEKGKLLRNYTQNIDTLEQVAGIHKVIECHGSFATASCTNCKYKQTADEIKAEIFAQRIPACPKCQPNVDSKFLSVENQNLQFEEISLQRSDKFEACETNDCALGTSKDQQNCNEKNEETTNREMDAKLLNKNHYRELVKNGIMKPDIVFFGEGLPETFHTAIADDKDECDLLIVIGSSMKVRPVALIPSLVPPTVPQILINLESLSHMDFDVELLGDSDTTIRQLCEMLGDEWLNICTKENADDLIKKAQNYDTLSSNIECLNTIIDEPKSKPKIIDSNCFEEILTNPETSDKQDEEIEGLHHQIKSKILP